MAYRRFHGAAKPTARVITVKYAGKRACCGAEIKAGEMATYYPPGTIASVTEGRIAHVGGLDGDSARCSAEIAKAREGKNMQFGDQWFSADQMRAFESRAVNDYAGDGLDERYEDDGARACGLL
jgi:hypothetical protein